jgi:hypothetical protein
VARFKEDPPEQAPAHLARFCLAEWDGVPPDEAIARWHKARMQWHEQHAVIAADHARQSSLGTWVDQWTAKRAVTLYWQHAEGVPILRNAVVPPACTSAECDGAARCALRS